MGHVIIEGLDKTGKSTLARFLSEKTGMPIKKFSAPSANEDPSVGYTEFVVTAQSCIVDRMHLSEMAYGPVMRGETTVDENVQRVIEGLLAKRGSVGIYCEANAAVLRERFIVDKEEFLSPDQITSVQHNFEEALKTSKMEWIRYTVGDDMEKIYDRIR